MATVVLFVGAAFLAMLAERWDTDPKAFEKVLEVLPKTWAYIFDGLLLLALLTR